MTALSELNLGGLAKSSPGRKENSVNAKVLRELSVEDFLNGKSDEPMQAHSVKALRTAHHQLARLLAKGISEQECTVITGYSNSRISILKSDPQFKDLLSYYTDMEKKGYELAVADVQERMKALALGSLEELADRLEQKSETFTNPELIKMAELVLDRTGHGKVSTVNGTVTHAIDDSTLARIRQGLSDNSGVAINESDQQALMGHACIEAEFTEVIEVEGSGGEGIELREETVKVVES